MFGSTPPEPTPTPPIDKLSVGRITSPDKSDQGVNLMIWLHQQRKQKTHPSSQIDKMDQS